VSNIGHWATGDLEITIKNIVDFEKAKPLLELAYNKN
jgi:predicted transport protein